ncbi:hypothetical protein Q75_02790 [Bacillus coahuilensis p1.1.43]|uniref:Uncharacterized protein n=1 Tax=Bacillus coahuilensis p1.1.43 TaxID=1150625 RepID=A0A147KBI6_9BACI|nr:hypothetical protein [Bacillus coahuilensis]KUP08443.1 hypothetical protein Q75_02790 [Bacillus coahuilensis p1.1.43]
MTKLRRVQKSVLNKGKKRTIEIYEFTKKRYFKKDGTFLNSRVKDVFDFAFNMSFGGKGEHRATRTGGDKKRFNGEKFANTFQGKLAEFAVQEHLKTKGIELDDPDIDVYGLGEWDKYDFQYNNFKISIKSTKFFGQLLLLETKDWSERGEYLPNKKRGDSDYIYDYFILVRIKPSIENMMEDKEYLKKNRLITNESISEDEIISDEKNMLEKLFDIKNNELRSNFEYEVAGVISNETLKYIIKNKYILPKHSYLGKSKTGMDAENYYIQVGNFKNIDELVNKITKNN